MIKFGKLSIVDGIDEIHNELLQIVKRLIEKDNSTTIKMNLSVICDKLIKTRDKCTKNTRKLESEQECKAMIVKTKDECIQTDNNDENKHEIAKLKLEWKKLKENAKIDGNKDNHAGVLTLLVEVKKLQMETNNQQKQIQVL